MKTKKKQIKTKEKKQVDASKDLKLDDQTKSIEEIFTTDPESNQIENERHKINKYENKVIRDNLFYELGKQVYDFETLKTIRSFGKDKAEVRCEQK